jgi:hypothetical protein
MEIQQDPFIEEMNVIKSYLSAAEEYGLEIEVITWALKAMKDDPSMSISYAMECGFYEWVK